MTKISLQDVEKHITQYIIGAIFSGAVAVVIFYFTTKNNLETLMNVTQSHSKDIREISDSINKLNLNVTKLSTKTDYTEKEPENIRENIKSIEDRMLRIEGKQDDIYKILINMNNTMVKRNK